MWRGAPNQSKTKKGGLYRLEKTRQRAICNRANAPKTAERFLYSINARGTAINSTRIPYCSRSESWSVGSICPPTRVGGGLAPLSVGPALTLNASTFLFKDFPRELCRIDRYKKLCMTQGKRGTASLFIADNRLERGRPRNVKVRAQLSRCSQV
jgi:hypothetical protein